MRIAMLTMEQYENRRENSVGSSRIRGNWVQKYCKDIVPFKNGGRYDAVIYQKAYWKTHMEEFKGIKIFDLCDADWLDGRPIREVLQLCDAFTVTTKPLQKYLKQMTDKPVIIIPDRIDPEAHVPVKEVHAGSLRTVVWFGYSSNQVVLDQVANYLQGKGIQLVVISDRKYRDADINIKYNYESINQDLIAYDAAILPPYTKNIKFTYKSNNKTLTCWALKLPVIHEIPDLERFNDPEERKKEAEDRYKEVIENYHVRDSGPEYVKLIESIQKAR